jgi:hypothetical protein
MLDFQKSHAAQGFVDITHKEIIRLGVLRLKISQSLEHPRKQDSRRKAGHWSPIAQLRIHPPKDRRQSGLNLREIMVDEIIREVESAEISREKLAVEISRPIRRDEFFSFLGGLEAIFSQSQKSSRMRHHAGAMESGDILFIDHLVTNADPSTPGIGHLETFKNILHKSPREVSSTGRRHATLGVETLDENSHICGKLCVGVIGGFEFVAQTHRPLGAAPILDAKSIEEFLGLVHEDIEKNESPPARVNGEAKRYFYICSSAGIPRSG